MEADAQQHLAGAVGAVAITSRGRKRAGPDIIASTRKSRTSGGGGGG
jgi:hypothetical protein